MKYRHRSYWIPGSYAPPVSENRSAFLRALKSKGFTAGRVAKIGADDLDNSTTLESNKSLLHLVTVMTDLGQRQVGFRSLCDGALDTTTATGELVFHLFSALAQFERRLIQERTRAGLAAARARGKHGGRHALRADAPQVRMAYTLSRDPRLRCQRSASTWALHVRRSIAMSPWHGKR